jgi:hypothetical protein
MEEPTDGASETDPPPGLSVLLPAQMTNRGYQAAASRDMVACETLNVLATSACASLCASLWIASVPASKPSTKPATPAAKAYWK